MSFCHLHLHSEYSLLDGACRIKDLVKQVKELGQQAVAVTDHGAMYGVIDFYTAAKQCGIKPIIGCEVYVAAGSRTDKSAAQSGDRSHLILLCENNVGYQNLIAMLSEAWITGFYGKPRVDKELLEKHHEGLIALSACLAGEVPKALLNNDYEEARRIALWYEGVFGHGNYYLELQNHSMSEQIYILPEMLRLSEETGIPLVATNDVHYIQKEDSKLQQVLICIQTNHVLGESTGLEFETNEFYLKSEDEMRALFNDFPGSIENTQIIADRCNVDFEFGHVILPHFEIKEDISHAEWLKNLCYKGIKKRMGDNVPAKYYERLDYELEVIENMGYVDYYLIVHDFIQYARNNGIPVGPGRGSGAGSIAAYSIGITGIDPIKYGLLFERFLNPERVSMPDFDIDFCYERRQEVIDYVVEKYGKDHVAQIITFGTLGAKAAIRDVGRVLGLPYSTVDFVAKQIPAELGMTIEKALTVSEEFRKQYNNPEIKELIDTASKLSGMPRHASTHAAGVVITRDPVATYVPLARNDEAIVTQFPMGIIEKLGLLKVDFLGLRTLTVISDAEEAIRKKQPEFSIENISISDEKVFDMLSKGFTEGVFQFESAGMRNVLTGLVPNSIEDLIAVISLYRPGPMDSIPKYIENRHNPERIRYSTPELEDILGVTNGCIVYQEQVMEIFRSLAGYSYGRADIVRRAMSKKNHEVMERERDCFINGQINLNGEIECDGAVRRGIDKDVANSIFDDMSSFASYAFNKSHAAAYALVAYQTAWLKCYYPKEYMAALLSSVLDNTAKVAVYISECNRLGITVMPPSVLYSDEKFEVKNDDIRFGLLAIKNLGKGFIAEILKERNDNGVFKSFYDFCKRLYGKDFNRRAVESIIKSGALDGLGANRMQMLQALPSIMASLESEKKRNISGQLGFFDILPNDEAMHEPDLPNVEEMPNSELLAYEKEVIGIYLTGHPMNEYRAYAESIGAAQTIDLMNASSDFGSIYQDNSNVNLVGIITSVKRKTTRSNETMAFLSVEDLFGSIEVIVFPKIFSENALILFQGKIIRIAGRLSLREDDEPKIVAELIEDCTSDVYKDSDFSISDNSRKESKEVQGFTEEKTAYNYIQNEQMGESVLYLRFPNSSCAQLAQVNKLLSIFEGKSAVVFYFSDSNEYIKHKNGSGVYLNDVMLNELNKILGSDSVIVKRRKAKI